MDDTSDIEQAKLAVQQGDKVRAQALLAGLVSREPDDALAWLLLADLLDDPQQAAYCRDQAQPRLRNLVGQEAIKHQLQILIYAALQKGEPLPHILLCGQPGMGKATFAKALANEMGMPIRMTAGPAIERPGDLAAILTSLRAGEVLFIDEVHRLGRAVGDVLYPAVEDLALDIIIGKGPSARSLRLRLPHFTVVGITYKPSQVDQRLRRLMLMCDFVPYRVHEIRKIILLLAAQQGIVIGSEAADLLAEHCEGCPGNASSLLKRAYDYAMVSANGHLTPEVAEGALAVFGKSPPTPADQADRLRAGQPIPDDVKLFVWQRDGGRCVKCGSQEKLEFDHIIPISKGGGNTARNLQLLCEKCNRVKGGNLV